MNKEQFKQIIDEAYHFLNNKGVGFICYVWEREGKEFGGGCQSSDADMADALVAIGRIVKRFNIDLLRLFAALDEIRREMEEN